MSTPFVMVGDPDAGVCVDGVCALPLADGVPDDRAATIQALTDEASPTP